MTQISHETAGSSNSSGPENSSELDRIINELSSRYSGPDSEAQKADEHLRQVLYGDTPPAVSADPEVITVTPEQILEVDAVEPHPGTELTIKQNDNDVDVIRSRAYIRRRLVVGGLAVGLTFAIGSGVFTAATRVSGGNSGGINLAASLANQDSNFVDGGYDIGPLPPEPMADIDISADSDLLVGLVAQSTEDPSQSGMIYIPTTVEIDGEQKTVPENILISKTPFGDDEAVNRAPVIRAQGTFGLGLLDNGMVVEAVSGNPDAIRVDRSKLQISTIIPREGALESEANPPFYNYEAYRIATENLPPNFTPESIEKANAVMDADPSTTDVIDKNPLLINAHTVEVLEDLPKQACYPDVTARLDAGLISFLQKEFSADDKKGRAPEVELVGTYTDPATTKRLILGDQQPKVAGEGDESRFSGDFKFANTKLSCENPRESTMASDILNSNSTGKDN